MALVQYNAFSMIPSLGCSICTTFYFSSPIISKSSGVVLSTIGHWAKKTNVWRMNYLTYGMSIDNVTSWILISSSKIKVPTNHVFSTVNVWTFEIRNSGLWTVFIFPHKNRLVHSSKFMHITIYCLPVCQPIQS